MENGFYPRRKGFVSQFCSKNCECHAPKPDTVSESSECEKEDIVDGEEKLAKSEKEDIVESKKTVNDEEKLAKSEKEDIVEFKPKFELLDEPLICYKKESVKSKITRIERKLPKLTFDNLTKHNGGNTSHK